MNNERMPKKVTARMKITGKEDLKKIER